MFATHGEGYKSQLSLNFRLLFPRVSVHKIFQLLKKLLANGSVSEHEAGTSARQLYNGHLCNR